MARKRKRPLDDDFVTVEDVWGGKHPVPRAWIPKPPPSGFVIDLTGPDQAEMVRWLAHSTGKSDDLSRGEMSISEGDFKRLIAMHELRLVQQRPSKRTGARVGGEKKRKNTEKRNEEMRRDFIVAVQTDERPRDEAIRWIAERYNLSVPHTRRIVGPLKIARTLRSPVKPA